mmetsp:Transcript_74950/g.199842  ORF Transcript_74950/g.199842 Transcript_74950/m.199842 type:complete len:101 (+) Transcript_74950:1157-1459(+)
MLRQLKLISEGTATPDKGTHCFKGYNKALYVGTELPEERPTARHIVNRLAAMHVGCRGLGAEFTYLLFAGGLRGLLGDSVQAFRTVRVRAARSFKLARLR